MNLIKAKLKIAFVVAIFLSIAFVGIFWHQLKFIFKANLRGIKTWLELKRTDLELKPILGEWKIVYHEEEFQLLERADWLNHMPRDARLIRSYEKPTGYLDRKAVWAEFIAGVWVGVRKIEASGTTPLPVAPKIPEYPAVAELMPGVKRLRGPFSLHKITFVDNNSGEKFTIDRINLENDSHSGYEINDEMFERIMNQENLSATLEEYRKSGSRYLKFKRTSVLNRLSLLGVQ